MGAQLLEVTDPAVAELIEAEQARQSETLSLIPSENYVSRAVLEAIGSVFTNKYSEGYPGRRYYEGQQVVDRLEPLAIERAKELFGVEHANVQPYSGSPANLAVYLAFAEPGDTSWGWRCRWAAISPTAGTSRSPASGSARSQYGVRRDTGRVDLDEVRELALRERPKLIFCGGTAIPRTIDFEGFADIAREVGADPGRRHRAHRRPDRRRRASLAGRARRRDLHHHAQDAARTARRDADVPGGARGGARPRRLPRAPGRPAQPHHRGDRRRARARRCAPRSRDYARQTVANAKALARRADGARLRPGLGRHRQPPDPDRPHEQGRPRQARRPGARPRPHRPPTTTPCRSTRASRSTPRGSGSARRRSPPAGWARRRWSGSRA